MGYMRNHAIVVTSFDREKIERAHARAFEIFLPVAKECSDRWARSHSMVSEILTSPINELYTFVVGPDGSKEGWKPSNLGDTARGEFIEWLDAQRYEDRSSPFDWVVVQYGDDGMDTLIDAHSDERKRRR